MTRICTTILIFAVLLVGCKNDEQIGTIDVQLQNLLMDIAPDNDISYFRLPSSTDLSKIPQDPNNPLTEEKIALGKLLFHETGLAIDPTQEISAGTYSCASCHFAQAGFQAGRFQGIGEGGIGFGVNGEGRIRNFKIADIDVQPLRTPSAMNGAYQKNMLWNGQFGATGVNVGTELNWTEDTPKEKNHLGFEGLEIQAIAGLEVHRLDIDETVLSMGSYKNMFDLAFGDVPEAERYTRVTAGLAIAAYERTVLANEAPFQEWLKGFNGALTESQKQGAILFFDKANCYECHNGPALNTMEFAALGMGDLFECGEIVFKAPEDDPAYLGRGSFTGNAIDNYKFKVPQLYNLKDSPFYGHGSTFKSIEDVIEYKNKAVPQNPNVPGMQLHESFVPLNLSNEEVAQITDFVENALYDSNLDRYVPAELPSGNCFPVNDEQSRVDLGCD